MKILFPFIGEAHQVFHALPVAAEIGRLRPDWDVQLLFLDELQLQMARRVQSVYPGLTLPASSLWRSSLLEWMGKLRLIRKRPRRGALLTMLPLLRKADAIVVPERTTTLIRRFLPSSVILINMPHGAGDRAITVDPRIGKFDFALIAGPKNEDRLLREGIIRPGRYAVTGYVKADLMQKLHAASTGSRSLFENDRPTVLYIPHFRRHLSSWDSFGREIIDRFARQDDYNLVVAPHYRLFSDAPASVREELEALSIPGKILVDVQSERLFDMSYTSSCDIYLGDVSSQVYEFLIEPRPCVFLNAHGVDWQGNPDYRFWTLGDVVEDVDQLMPAIREADQRHPTYGALQVAAVTESMGEDITGAAERSAKAILDFLAPDMC